MKDENRKLGGDEAKPSEPNTLPTVQAETAVVGELLAALEELHNVVVEAWPNLAPLGPLADAKRVIDKAKEQPPVSTGEQPGMGEAESAWLEAEAQLSEISAAIGTTRFMDPPDGGGVTLAEQVRRMRDALDEAEALPDDLLSLSEAATAGEWRWTEGNLRADSFDGTGIDEFVLSIDHDVSAGWATIEATEQDKALIVASVNFIRTLAAKQGGKS